MNVLITAALVVLAAGALSAGGLFLAGRIPERWLAADSNAASTIYATVGMVYAILIAVAAIAVWEPRTDVHEATGQEAAALVEMHWAASALPPADRTEIRDLIRGYLEEASGNEWRNLHDNLSGTTQGNALFTRLRERIDAVVPKSDRELSAQQQLASYASQVSTARLARISAAKTGLPALLWWILIIGGLISILLLYMFGLKATFPNLLMLSVAGGMLALMIFVIYQVEYPYSRAFAVGPDSLRNALHLFTSS